MLTDPSILNPPKRVNPQFHFIYGKEKCGKTSASVQLPDSYLLELVHEGAGADYLAYRGHAFGSLAELRDSYKQLKTWNQERKFRRLIVDTADALVSWLEDEASKKYKTLINKENAPIVATVMELGYGKGTEMLAQMFKDELAALRCCCDELLLLGHCKEFDKTEQAVDAKEVDLPGKLRNKIVYAADAAAYCFQKDDQLWLTYANKDEIAGGSRALHLAGQRIMLSEMKNGKLQTFWEKIYLPEPSAQVKAESK
jgi:hypothetical protein